MRRISRGWSKVQGRLMKDNKRPFFVYPWRLSLKVDLMIMLWMTCLPLILGLPLVFLPFKGDVVDTTRDDHTLFAYVGMPLLGFATGKGKILQMISLAY